jgi:hypothetical protein
MSKKSAPKAVSMRTAVSVIGALGFLIGFVFLVLHQVNFLVGRSLLIAFGNGADSTYKGAWFDLKGDLVAKDFVLKPYGDDVDVTLTFKKVRVDTPGWLWIVRNLRSRKLIADTDRLHVTLEDGTSDGGVDPSLGDLGPFGTDTASPFEAEGCLQDTVWVRSELIDMGLTPGPTVLDFDYRVDGSKLDSRISLETPGVSKVTLTRHEKLPGNINPYLLDLTATATTDEHWQVEDQGFVKARNAFCAKRDGTSEAEFVARHVASVQRLLAIEGLALDEVSMAAYADFARKGGTINFGGSYVTPLPSEIYYEARETGKALTRMHGIIERDGRKLVAQWSTIAPRPLPGLETMATFEALQKEPGYAGPSAVPSTVASTVASTVPTTAPSTVASTVPTTAPSAVASTASNPGSNPAPSVGATAVPAPAPAALAKLGDEIPWADLSRYINRDFVITTGHMGAREVVLIAANAGEITVEGSVHGGRVKNRIYKDGFSRAVLIR